MFFLLYVYGLVIPAMALDQASYAAMQFMPRTYLYLHGIELGKPQTFTFKSAARMQRPEPENDAFWFIPASATDIKVVISPFGSAAIADFKIDKNETWDLLGVLSPLTDRHSIEKISQDMARCPWRYNLEGKPAVYELLRDKHKPEYKHYLIINNERTIAWYYHFSKDFIEEAEELCNLNAQ